MKLIAIMAKATAGKDTVSSMLLEKEPRGATIAFADKLKEICMDLYDLSHDDVYTEAGKNRVTSYPCLKCPSCGSLDVSIVTTTTSECKACNSIGEAKAYESFWTVRMILQYVGTEGLRRVDDKVWVRQALKRIKAQFADRPFVILTDCRFLSEAKMVWEAQGEVWRLRRPSTDNKGQGITRHSSETQMDEILDAQFQYIINNNGTLDNLRAKVHIGLSNFLERRAEP